MNGTMCPSLSSNRVQNAYDDQIKFAGSELPDQIRERIRYLPTIAVNGYAEVFWEAESSGMQVIQVLMK